MDLILLRHAEKEFFGGDPFLSDRGREQARRLPIEWGAPAVASVSLISSPKRRALETLQPLAEAWGRNVVVDAALDERRPGESGADFSTRVRRSIESFEAAPPGELLVLCSHLDWIEEFRLALACVEDLTRYPYDHWPSSQSLHLSREGTDRPWTVTRLGRNP